MSSAKEEELKELWREVVKKEQKRTEKRDGDGDGDSDGEEEVVSVNGLKNQVTMITKNASTTRKMYVNMILI